MNWMVYRNLCGVYGFISIKNLRLRSLNLNKLINEEVYE